VIDHAGPALHVTAVRDRSRRSRDRSLSADGGAVSADAGSASADAGHHSDLKPERPPGSEPRGYLDPFGRGDRADECEA
jgi:hypothetical protein